VRSDGLYGIKRPDRLFNYSIYMIVKGDPKYIQFVHTLDAEHFIGISELSFLDYNTTICKLMDLCLDTV